MVRLPELCKTPIKAKIDTGARTSSLHAFNLELSERSGVPWVEFEIHPIQRSKRRIEMVDHPVTAFRRVRSSSGHVETRPVITTGLGIGGETYPIEITLTSRDEMGFRMLLGRSALRRRFLIDPSRSYVQTEKPRPKGKKK